MKTQLNYDLTEHAAKRASQRALSPELLSFLMLYGEVREQKGGGYLLSMGQRDRKRWQRTLKKILRELDNTAPMTAVMGDDGKIITLMRESKAVRSQH
jgi:hypothetical protein